jgi:hypothetical protein
MVAVELLIASTEAVRIVAPAFGVALKPTAAAAHGAQTFAAKIARDGWYWLKDG